MRVTVCELRNEPDALAEDWAALVEHTKREGSELVLLPELGFHPWLAALEVADDRAWEESMRVHEEWIGRLGELGADTVLATRPVMEGGKRYNEAYVWSRSDGRARSAHRKHYLPEEPGFWEATWTARGGGEFRLVDGGGARVGFLVCTELWFTRHARDYAKDGMQILATPRATMAYSREKWLVGGRAAAVVSGAWSLSSNLSGPAAYGETWAGLGWIVEPEGGEVVGTTSPDAPFLTREIDLAAADAAKRTYPRDVLD